MNRILDAREFARRRRQLMRMAVAASMVLAVVLLYGATYVYKSSLG